MFLARLEDILQREPTITNRFGEEIWEDVLAFPKIGSKSQSVSTVLVRLKPETSSELHYHNIITEVYHIVQGRPRMLVDRQWENLSAGDTIMIVPGQRHRIVNPGDIDVLFWVDSTPAWFEGDFYPQN